MAERSRFGVYDFDARTGELRREGQVVKLSPQPARVLALLLTRPGELVLRDELRKELWGEDTFVDFERGLNFCIVQVRTALGDAADNPRFVQTVPRRGYRFIAPVTNSPTHPIAPPGEARPRREAALPPGGRRDREARPSGPRLRLLLLVALGSLLVVSASGAIWWSTVPAAPPSARTRVAVLPFVNHTGDADVDDLADGLTDDVIAQLGLVGSKRLAVIARTSVMTFQNSPKTVSEIGRDLGVSFVVESSIRREGEALRIAASLVDVSDQSQRAVWSEVFGGQAAASGAPQTDIAIRLARLIAVELVRDDAGSVAPIGTKDAEAWTAFVKGRALLAKGTGDAVRASLAAFEAAARQDSSFAAAWAEAATTRHLLVMMGAARPLDAYPAASEAADRALAADGELPEAHLAKGLVDLWYRFRPDQAAQSFERALALNASSAAARHDYAWALVALGRDEQAIAQMAEARDLDPLSTRANNDMGWLYLQLNRPAEAATACQHTLAVQPSSLEAQACLERAYTLRGLPGAALDAARATTPAASELALSTEPGRAAESLRSVWRWRLARLQEAAKTRWISPHTLAVSHVLLGNHDAAFAELAAAVEERAGMLVFMRRDPALAPLRGDPRFAALAARVDELSGGSAR